MTGFVSCISPGYTLRAIPRGEPAEWRHRLFGAHAIAGAVSPNSGRPLLRLLQLDTADPRLALRGLGGGLLPLLFSWTCDISQAAVTYRVTDGSAISLVTYQRGRSYADFPYPSYPTYFPERAVELVPLSAREQDAIRDLNLGRPGSASLPPDLSDLCVPRHQVGGEPFLVQPWLSLDCPSCKRAMPFLASIGDDSGTPKGLTGNRFVQICFSYCRRCGVLAARQQCD